MGNTFLGSFLSFYLFFFSLSLIDISPPAQGVDHRHVQKELGEVMVRLHNPVVVSPTTIQVTWTVSAAYLFAYRIQLCLANATHTASTLFSFVNVKLNCLFWKNLNMKNYSI